MLPKIEHPVFKIHSYGLDKELSFRPFLVKEEKILLIAAEEGNQTSLIEAMVKIINNCCLDEVDIGSLPMFDLEHLFLRLREKSVDNTVSIVLTFGEKEIKKIINLADVVVKIPEGHTKVVELSEMPGLKIKMKYPSVSMVDKIKDLEKPSEFLDMYMFECVDYIYDEDTVYDDFTQEELNEFISNLTSSSHNKIKEFFETSPTLYYEFEIDKPDGEKEKIIFKSVTDFFIFV